MSQRGHSYEFGRAWKWVPTLKQLGRYCQCDNSTLSRIASGKIASIAMDKANILGVLALIYPPVYKSADIELNSGDEQRARIKDADAWLQRDKATRGPLSIHFWRA